MSDLIYFVFSGGNGPAMGPHRDRDHAKALACACAETEGRAAEVVGVPVAFVAEIAPPLKADVPEGPTPPAADDWVQV